MSLYRDTELTREASGGWITTNLSGDSFGQPIARLDMAAPYFLTLPNIGAFHLGRSHTFAKRAFAKVQGAHYLRAIHDFESSSIASVNGSGREDST